MRFNFFFGGRFFHGCVIAGIVGRGAEDESGAGYVQGEDKGESRED